MIGSKKIGVIWFDILWGNSYHLLFIFFQNLAKLNYWTTDTENSNIFWLNEFSFSFGSKNPFKMLHQNSTVFWRPPELLICNLWQSCSFIPRFTFITIWILWQSGFLLNPQYSQWIHFKLCIVFDVFTMYIFPHFYTLFALKNQDDFNFRLSFLQTLFKIFIKSTPTNMVHFDISLYVGFYLM